jgi:hypothetical protein
MKTFSSNMANGLYKKNLPFYTNFKNVTLILVKSAPKSSFSPKTVLVIGKKNFGCTFAIRIKRGIFYPIRPISSHGRRVNVYFL